MDKMIHPSVGLLTSKELIGLPTGQSVRSLMYQPLAQPSLGYFTRLSVSLSMSLLAG